MLIKVKIIIVAEYLFMPEAVQYRAFVPSGAYDRLETFGMFMAADK